jgi:light-regulated signal transduction histidine kinase (bacteriophytochrome)
LEALPELAGQGLDELLTKVYKTGESYVGIEYPLTLARDEGLAPELRYFNFSYQPMYDENNNIHSILAFGYEVTEEVNAKNAVIAIQRQHSNDLELKIEQSTMELRQANKELLDNNEKLVKLNKELESFNYISSHDLQEPLRKIQMFTGRILESEDKLSLVSKDHFLRIQASAWRMQTLIQDLLSYAHVSIAEHTFKKVRLSSVIEDVINDLSENISEAGAEVSVNAPCEINVDASQLRQVINNLISNSLKYVRPDVKPIIQISCEIAIGKEFNVEGLNPNKKYSLISISDNGIGIDGQYHNKIFDVFQRLHHKDNYAGTGIGLAIVKKIVENHSGIIRVLSKINEGATFEIYIPQK